MKLDAILVLYFSDIRVPQASTLSEHIFSFERYSQHNVITVNTFLGFPKELLDFEFKVIILHYSMFTCAASFQFSPVFEKYLLEARNSFKVMIFQDECYVTDKRIQFLNHLDIDYLFTILDSKYHDEVYFKNTNVKYVTSYIPGYVDNALFGLHKEFSRPWEERELDIAYRGRKLSYDLGKGGREKAQIGEFFKSYFKNEDFKIDVEIDEEYRIYGDEWYKFLGNSKFTLGTESGSTIFDPSGEFHKKYKEYMLKENDPSFEKVSKDLLRHHENKISYRSISPRVFEAAALFSCQILYEGEYSGILEPGKHYIALKKDHSNINEIISLLNDQKLYREMTQLAYEDLIMSGKYTYEKFVTEFDTFLSEKDLISESESKENLIVKLFNDGQKTRSKFIHSCP